MKLATIARYVVVDLIRNRWLIGYVLFFFVFTEGLLYFTAGTAKTIVGLMQVVILLIPLASLFFGTLHVQNSRDFVELVLTQPIKRSSVFNGLYLGICVPFTLLFLIGVGIPLLINGLLFSPSVLTLLGVGSFLTVIFLGIGFLVGIRSNDRSLAMGLSFLLWLLMAIVYDGVILLISVAFADYPLESASIAMVSLNPLDLARIVTMLSMDYAALMGYTGAVFSRYFGSGLGFGLSIGLLTLWSVLPYIFARRSFERKDW